MNSFSRVATAFCWSLRLLAGSLPVSRRSTQTRRRLKAPATTEPTATAKERQQAPKKDQARRTPKTVLPQRCQNKPLSVNEDPNMIGKRNINKGIIAKMSGSTEKEVRLGRELAAEVDRQAKFIETR